MVAMPPCPRSSMSRYRPPRTLPISAKSLLPSCRVALGRQHRSVPTARADRAGSGVQTLRDALTVTEGTDRGTGPPGVRPGVGLGARRLGPDDAVAIGLVLGDLHDRDHGGVRLRVRVHQLADAWPLADHDIVREDHREGLVADELLGHEHRVAEP